MSNHSERVVSDAIMELLYDAPEQIIPGAMLRDLRSFEEAG